MTTFTPLINHTHFSLLGGIGAPKSWAAAAQEAGFSALGITDTNCVYGAVAASKAFAKEGVQPLLGAQVTVTLPHAPTESPTARVCHVLAQNQQGWENVLALVTALNLESAHPSEKTCAFETLLKHNEGVILLTGGNYNGLLQTETDETHLQALHQAFGDRLYIELQRHPNSSRYALEQQREPLLLNWAASHNIPVVATNDNRFLKPELAEAFEALTCIGEGLTVDDPNHVQWGEDFALKSAEAMAELFADIPSALENTNHIAKRCAFLLEAVPVKEMFMPKWQDPSGLPTPDVLRKQSQEGFQERWEAFVQPFVGQKDWIPTFAGKTEAEVRAIYDARLEEELNIIINMGFDGYFVITADFIQWAKDNGIPVGPGRGSGAGSLVAWSLKITDLDPIRWGLYFERFLNPERVSLPDFDIDFCQDRRGEVIRYVQQKYGRENVSQIITFGSLKAKACIRDVGRVLQMPYGLVEKISKCVPDGPAPPPIAEVLKTEPKLQELIDTEDGVGRCIELAQQLEGCLRHASTHAAGVMIADRPIVGVTGLFLDPKSDMPATQLSMFDAEYSGLVKFDFLGLKTLTTIQTACDLVAKNGGEQMDPLMFPLDDEKSYARVAEGFTTGVFQIESGGMTDLMVQMQPDDMENLSAAVALYRPGPMENIPKYVACKFGREKAKYLHPSLEPILDVTYGIPVYQEQVMQMARTVAGYTLGGADMLRRAMGKKIKEAMDEQRDIFVQGAKITQSIEPDLANQIFDQMAAFAGYGFNKAHSMAYALVAFQTAYLKAHHPVPFMAATMTLDKGNVEKLAILVNEVKKLGYRTLPPSVNHSEVDFSVEKDGDLECVRYALSAIKGAGEDAMGHLVKEREKGGRFNDMWNLLERVPNKVLNKKNLEVLMASGALDCLGMPRTQLLANTETFLQYAHSHWAEQESSQNSLFGAETVAIEKPRLLGVPQETLMQRLMVEAKVIGFYLSAHPLDAYGETLKQVENVQPLTAMAELAKEGKKLVQVAGVIVGIREIRTKSGGMMAILRLSDHSGEEEVVAFPEAYAQFAFMLNQNTPEPLVLGIGLGIDKESGRLRANIESVKLMKILARQTQQAKAPDHIKLRLSSATDLPKVQQLLIGARDDSSKTSVELTLPNAQGQPVTMAVPFTVNALPTVLNELKPFTV